MENLIKKLQVKAGLSEEQAINTINVVKDYMDEKGIDIDWNKLAKDKFENIKEQTQSFFGNVKDKAQNYKSKLDNKVDDLALKATIKAQEITKKASEYIDEYKKEN